MNNFAWVVKMLFWYLALHRHISAVLKVCTNVASSPGSLHRFTGTNQHGYYFREHLYSQTSLKAWDSEEKLAFSLRLLLSHHIAWLAMFLINCGILISLWASAYHPYTTLTTGKWMISWPSEDSSVEVGSTECSCHKKFIKKISCRNQKDVGMGEWSYWLIKFIYKEWKYYCWQSAWTRTTT